MSALDLVMNGVGTAAEAVPTGFNQGLVSMVGTAYNAMVNAPKMIAGVGAVLVGRPDMAPDVREGTALAGAALDSAGLGFLTAAPPAGDVAANVIYKTAGLAPGFLVPDAEIGNVGDMAVGALVKASSLASGCPTCAATTASAATEAGAAMGSAESAAGDFASVIEREALGFEKSAEDLFSHLLDVVGDTSKDDKK
jgi:hypothetical protein